MATNLELFMARYDSDLQDKVTVAVIVAADTVRTDVAPPANQAQRLVWAKTAMSNPKMEAQRMLWALLAANKSAPLATILAASDATIQTAVDAAIDLFAGS